MALAGHRSAGKTSLAEALLQAAGVTRTVGRVRDGSALLDFLPIERRRGLSLQPSFAWLDWGDTRLHLIDTPGSDAATHARRMAVAAADALVVVVDLAEGPQLGAELALAEAAALGIPRWIVLTRMDRTTDPQPALSALRSLLGAPAVPVLLPAWGPTGAPLGVWSLWDGCWHPSGAPDAAAPLPTADGPEVDGRPAAWEVLSEAVAATDDALLERYLEDFALAPPVVRDGLVAATRRGALVPVLFANADPLVGVRPLLDALVTWTPTARERPPVPGWDADGEPLEVTAADRFVAQWVATQRDDEGELVRILRVWSGEAPPSGLWTHGPTGAPARVRKLYHLRGPRRATASQLGPGALIATWDPLPGTLGDAYTTGDPLHLRAPEAPSPMVDWWIGPLGADGKPAPPRSPEARRFPEVLAALGILDPSVWIGPEVVHDGRVIRGASEAQLAWFVERAAEWFGSVWATGPAPVPYREMPARGVTAVVGVHKIEDADGLVSAFGEVHVDLEPAEERVGGATDVVVENYLTGDEIPPKFHAAVLAGVHEGAVTGPRGRPVAGAVFRVVGGEYDILESTDAQLHEAGRIAAQAALARAGTRLLEPWVEVVVWVVPDAAGETLAELAARRGRILGLEVAGVDAAIHAVVPYRELRSFAPRLQSLTGGRGRFLADAWRWEPLPPHLEPERDDRRP